MAADNPIPARQVKDEEHGLRLDAFLELMLPELGLRARRRLWEGHEILVNGRSRLPGYFVRAGEGVEVRPKAASPEAEAPLPAGPRIVKRQGDFLALAKGAGLHSARLAGRANLSLESLLEANWPELWAACSLDPTPPCPLLCNRLDRPTSGIVLAALGQEALERFRQAEAAGLVRKEYYALVLGKLKETLLLDQPLDTCRRKITLVLPGVEKDVTRHTLVEPLPGNAALSTSRPGCTLIRAVIKRGARHQIRAHLAAVGFHILGDALYGKEASDPMLFPDRLFLHHFRISWGEFEASYPPDWI